MDKGMKGIARMMRTIKVTGKGKIAVNRNGKGLTI